MTILTNGSKNYSWVNKIMRAQNLILALASIALVGCSDTATDLSTQVPNALAGADQSVNEGATVTLDGSASNSPSGNALSYSWQQVGASGVSLSGASSATATFVPEVSADTQLTFELSVTDSSGASASDQVLIAVNNAPTATISADAQSGLEGASIAISGAQSSDSDGGSIASYSWSQLEGTQATFSSTDSASTSITLPIISADSEELVFQLQVTDNDSATSTSSLTITVLNDATNPDISAVSVAEGSYGIGASATITITAANSESGLQLPSGSSFNGQQLTGFAEVGGTAGAYTATYTVASGDSDWSAGSTVDTGTSITLVDSAGNASATITEVALGANTSIDANAPTAKAGNNQTINEAAEDLVQLDGTSSFDAYDGSIASYSWQQIDFIAAHAVELFIGGTNGSQASFAAPQDLVEDTTLTFQLSVTDSVGNSDTDTIEVLVNNAPTAVIAVLANDEATDATTTGDAQQVNEGDAITLDGSGSSDSDNDTIASYSWVQVADIDGNSLSSGALGLSGSDTATATFTAPDDDEDTTLYFQLTVTDDGGASSSDIVAIAINNNPTITMDDGNPGEVNEGDEVTFKGSSTDTDDDTIESYSWKETNDLVNVNDVTLIIKEGSGNFTAVFTAPDNLTADTTLTFDITVTDGKGGVGTKQVTLLVNNSPTANAGADAEYNETVGDTEVKVTLDGSASSDTNTSQGSSIADYSWREIKLDEDDNVVDVTGDDSVINDSYDKNITTISFTAPTVDQDTLLTFQLTVTDNDGANHTDTIIVTINNSPTAAAGIDQEVNESVTVTLSGSGTDTDSGSSVEGYSWQQVEANPGGSEGDVVAVGETEAVGLTIDEDDPSTATFTAPKVEVNESNEGVTTLTFQLTVTDNDGATHSDLVEVAVHNLPVVESVYLIDGAYGIGDTATVYIRAGDQETGLTLKQEDNTDHGSFNGGLLADFSEIGDGLYSATYTISDTHASVINGGEATTNITLVDQTEKNHESEPTTAVTLEGEYIDTVRPAIDFITIADGAYGIGDEMTLYIQVEGNEAGLVIKDGSDFTFNGVALSTLEDIGNGTYQTVYTVGSAVNGEAEADQADGAYVPITITLTDPAGNDSVELTSMKLDGESIDLTKPIIAITSVGGDDNVTNSSEVSAAAIVGTTANVEDGQTVTITVTDSATPSESVTTTTTVSGNSFSTTIDLSALTDGEITATANVSDAAGNGATTSSSNESIKIDTTPPTQGVGSISLSADTGTEGDFITNIASQTITATLNSALGTDEILYGSVDSGTNWEYINDTIGGENNTEITWSSAKLESGTQKIIFRITDIADNNATFEQEYTLDATDPTQTIDTTSIALSADTGISATDFITNTASQTITATLSSALGTDEILYGSVDSGTNWEYINDTIGGENNTEITWSLAKLESGTQKIIFRITDIADNNATFEQEYTLDATDPTQTIYTTSIALSADTGTEGDFITNIASQTITATLNSALGTDEILYGSVDSGTNWEYINDTIGGENNTEITWSSAKLESGTQKIIFRITDIADNNATFEQEYTLDATDPTQTIYTTSIALSADTGTEGDFITNIASQTITATLNSALGTDEILYGSVDSGTNWEYINDTIGGENNTEITWSSAKLESGTQKIIFRITDIADNNATFEQEYTLDATDPTQTIYTTSIALSADTGISATDFITNTASQTITATLSSALGTDEILYGSVDSGTNWEDINDTIGGENNTEITWSSAELESGTQKIIFRITDIADNNATFEQEYTLDTTPPGIDSISIAPTTNTTGIYKVGDLVEVTITAKNSDTGLVFSTKTFSSNPDNSGGVYNLGEVTEVDIKNSPGTYTTTYTVVEGHDDVAAGNDVITIGLSFTDAAGNAGSYSDTVDLSSNIDANSPTIDSSSISVAAGTYGIGGEIAITINASESGLSLHGFGDEDDGANGTFNGQKITDFANLGTSNTYTGKYTVIANDASVADEGEVDVNIALVDASGNIGTAVTKVMLNGTAIDAQAPAITSASIVDSGNYVVGDSIIIYVTSEASEGSAVQIKDSSTVGTNSYALTDRQQLANSSDVYTAVYVVQKDDVVDTENNTNTLASSIILTDSAGNDSEAWTTVDVPDNFTIDASSPTQTISDIALSADTGPTDGTGTDDFITKTAGQTITATLGADLGDGDSLYGSVDADSESSWSDITNADNVSFTDIDGSDSQIISWATTLSEGTNKIGFQVRDSSGNEGEATTQQYTLDTVAPTIALAATEITASEASTATLDASTSSDNDGGTGIVSYAWKQVESGGGTLDTGSTELSISDASSASTTATTPVLLNVDGSLDESTENVSFYFQLTIEDLAGNEASEILALTVSNYTTPAITATAGTAPDFDQVSLSWDADSSLTYSLYRSTQDNCFLGNYQACSSPALYTDSTGLSIADTSASVADSGLAFLTSYYYWLETKRDSTVIALSPAPGSGSATTESSAMTSGPQLNDTGVVAGGDYPSGFDTYNGSNTACNGGYLDSGNSNTFVAFTDEDCEVGRDANNTINSDADGHAGFSFTRLNFDGSEYSGTGEDYTTQPWSCVIDNVTGLVWEIKTTNGGTSDNSNQYTWYDGTNPTTQELVDATNTAQLCGLTNWRLPTVQEIESLASYNYVPAIDADYLPNTKGDSTEWYWTTDPDSSGSNKLWAYNAYSGSTASAGSGSTYYVRLVSSSDAVGAWFSDYSDSRYTDHEDGTISDQRTGLMWMKCSYDLSNTVCDTGTATSGDWQAAFDKAATANDNGGTFTYTDWRLPNKKELSSIVDLTSNNPAINQTIFPNTQSADYWTATPSAADDSKAFTIDFTTGTYGAVTRNTTTDTVYVRLVRDITTND